jgi:hypothetical protein
LKKRRETHPSSLQRTYAAILGSIVEWIKIQGLIIFSGWLPLHHRYSTIPVYLQEL